MLAPEYTAGMGETNDLTHGPARSASHGRLSMLLATHARSRRCTGLIFPLSTLGPQLQQQAFSRREQFFESSIRLGAIVSPVEDGDLQTDLGPVPALRRVHDAMHRRVRVLAGLQKIQRLKEHAA